MIELNSTIILSVTLFIIILVLLLVYLKSKQKHPYFSRETLCTAAELRFYKVLQKVVLKNQIICPKVRLADIINCSDINWKKSYGAPIAQKHIDFVLIDSESSKILLCIELDDATHDLPNRKKRDIFINKTLQSASIALLRIKVAKGYDMAFLKKEIMLALRTY